MAAIADTSFLVALLSRDDAHHAGARAMFEQEPCIVPLPVLTEFLSHMEFVSRRTAVPDARQCFHQLTQILRVRVEPTTSVGGPFRLYEANPGLSLVDCIGVAEAVHRGCDLWTFDNKQAATFKAARSA